MVIHMACNKISASRAVTFFGIILSMYNIFEAAFVVNESCASYAFVRETITTADTQGWGGEREAEGENRKELSTAESIFPCAIEKRGLQRHFLTI